MSKLKNARREVAHGTPRFRYIGVVANGRTAPAILREQVLAAMADAAKIS